MDELIERAPLSRESIKRGIEQAHAGETVPFEDVLADLDLDCES